MSPSERDRGSRQDSPADAGLDDPERMGSNADTENSAAHIAELVRRTSERLAAPGSPPVADPNPTPAQPVPMAPAQARRPAARPISSPPPPSTSHLKAAPSRQTLIIAGAVIAALLAGGIALSHSPGSDEQKPPAATARSSTPADYSVKLSDVVTDCAGHARGQVKTKFQTVPCVKATRSLATGQIGGRPVLFVVSRIQMPSPLTAASIKQVLDGSGTGNLNDLLREGKTFTGAPDKMPASGYTSVQSGAVVTVVEAGFTDGGPSSSTDATLRASAAQVATMVSAQK